MRVRDLIAALQKHHPDEAVVAATTNGDYVDVADVRTEFVQVGDEPEDNLVVLILG